MRTVNLDALRFWLVQNGELAKEELAVKTRIPFYTLDRILQGKTVPKEVQQIALCRALKMDRDELFPVSKQEKSAS